MNDTFPEGWTKTIKDLFAEAKSNGSSVGPPETEWASAYERSRLRPWARFPADGDIYEALQDTLVSYMTHWAAPLTGGGDGTLPKSTKVRVKVFDFMTEPVSVYATPLNDKEIELLLVPEQERRRANYNGFSLSISTADLNTFYRLVPQ